MAQLASGTQDLFTGWIDLNIDLDIHRMGRGAPLRATYVDMTCFVAVLRRLDLVGGGGDLEWGLGVEEGS